MTHAFCLARLRASFAPKLAATAWLAASAMFFGELACAASDSATEQAAPIDLLVLDLEIVGDLSDPALAPVHAARIEKTSAQLRTQLADVPRHRVVDATPERERLESLRSTQYLYKCNGCEIDVAAALGADQVLVAWVHRVSHLILSLTYEIRDVPSGQPLRRKAFDFRGDTDEGWSRAVSVMVKDIASQ